MPSAVPRRGQTGWQAAMRGIGSASAIGGRRGVPIPPASGRAGQVSDICWQRNRFRPCSSWCGGAPGPQDLLHCRRVRCQGPGQAVGCRRDGDPAGVPLGTGAVGACIVAGLGLSGPLVWLIVSARTGSCGAAATGVGTAVCATCIGAYAVLTGSGVLDRGMLRTAMSSQPPGKFLIALGGLTVATAALLVSIPFLFRPHGAWLGWVVVTLVCVAAVFGVGTWRLGPGTYSSAKGFSADDR